MYYYKITNRMGIEYFAESKKPLRNINNIPDATKAVSTNIFRIWFELLSFQVVTDITEYIK